jgi:osmotically-inducible protein OsmY
MKPDYQLQEDVVEELAFDPSVDASNIAVAAKAGVVTLTGRVSSYAEKLAAERAVKHVAGVHAIAEELEIDLPAFHERSDADIAAEVINALNLDVTIPRDAISATVERGRVTLDGQVEWQYQKENAHRAIAHLRGVRSICDLIRVAPRPSVTDLRESLRKTFRRNAEIDADRLIIETNRGTVTLRGPVHSLAESTAATHAAFSVPGVSNVKNLTYIE